MDAVNNPAHYGQGSVECIQAIEASMSLEEFQGYCKGNSLKYLWRWRHKGKAKEDLEKSQWYLKRLIDTLPEPQESPHVVIDGVSLPIGPDTP